MAANGEPEKPPAAASQPRRARTTTVEALRYTKFVTLMRRALPLAAVAILALVALYAFFPRHSERYSLSYQKTGVVVGDLAMKKPRLSGTDDKGNPYLITADLAVQDKKNAHRATLINVAADLQYGGNRWASASAGKGVVDLDAKTLELADAISIYTDSGYELHTRSAYADLASSVISGREKVEGHGPLGSMTADSFRIDRNRRHVTLQGNVRMKLYPKKVKP
jgi:lipopolysaccharide export system protein LptC